MNNIESVKIDGIEYVIGEEYFMWDGNNGCAKKHVFSGTREGGFKIKSGIFYWQNISKTDPFSPIEEMKGYAIETGTAEKCNIIKDFIRANGGKAYENGSSDAKYIHWDSTEFIGNNGRGIATKTISFQDACEKWNIPVPEPKMRKMTMAEIIRADKEGAVFRHKGNGQIHTKSWIIFTKENFEICYDITKGEVEDWEFVEMVVPVGEGE
jgi:hypothetical protein